MFPLETVTMLGSAVLGGIMKLWGMSRQAQHEKDLATLNAFKAESKVFKEAREYNNKGFVFTRRIIALLAVSAIIVWPLLVPVFWPYITVTHGWTEFHPGFLFLPDKEVMDWHTVQGLVITPMHTHTIMSIMGLYFGGSIVGHRR